MDEVLARVDRASMQNALEIRSPFLDHELVEFVQGLPYDFKLHGFTGKYMLKQLMKGTLPDEIVNRKKKGFGVPIGRWLQNELKPLSDRLLSKASIEASGFFDHAIVQQLKAEHEGGTRDHRKKLWTLMVFQMWYEQWCA